MIEDINNQTTEQQQTTPTPEEAGEKLFTQKDLDRIVGERLARAKRDANTDKREADLIAREARLTCREYLSAEKLPAELADILPTADAETFKANVKKLAGLFQPMEPPTGRIRVDFGGPLGGNPGRSTNTVADAFKPPKI